jgi:hypothetical protein
MNNLSEYAKLMAYTIDKKSPTGLKVIMQKWPQNLSSEMYGYTGPYMNIYTDKSTIADVLGYNGLNCGDISGISAVYIGSTETGEYRGVYVFYGTHDHAYRSPRDPYALWYPVKQVKRYGKRLSHNCYRWFEVFDKNATQTVYAKKDFDKLMQNVKEVKTRVGAGREITKAVKFGKRTFVTFTIPNDPYFGFGRNEYLFWYEIEKYER